MLVRVLETVELSVAGRPVPLGGSKHRSVLHCLALRANTVVPVDDLLGALWEGTPPRTARKMVQNVVSELRATISHHEWYTATAPWDGGESGPGNPDVVLLTHGPGYVLRIAPEQVDALCFERGAREGLDQVRHGACEEGLTSLRAALALWPQTSEAAGPAARWPGRLRLKNLRREAERYFATDGAVPGGTVLVLAAETAPSTVGHDAESAVRQEARVGEVVRDQVTRHQGVLGTEFGSLRVAVFPDGAGEPGLVRTCTAAGTIRAALADPDVGHRTTVTVLLPGRAAPGGAVSPAIVDEGLAALATTEPGTTRLLPVAESADVAGDTAVR